MKGISRSKTTPTPNVVQLAPLELSKNTTVAQSYDNTEDEMSDLDNDEEVADISQVKHGALDDNHMKLGDHFSDDNSFDSRMSSLGEQDRRARIRPPTHSDHRNKQRKLLSLSQSPTVKHCHKTLSATSSSVPGEGPIKMSPYSVAHNEKELKKLDGMIKYHKDKLAEVRNVCNASM